MSDTTETTEIKEENTTEAQADAASEAPAPADPEEKAAEPEAEAEADDGLLVKLVEVSDVERRLEVTVPKAEVQGKLAEAYKELSKGISLKGFRRGKVPRRMLHKLFGKHLNKEVAHRVVQESLPKAVAKVEIKPVGEPEFEYQQDDLEKDEDFAYKATVPVMPEIDPEDYFGVEVTAMRGKISDEDVERALEAKQRELTDYRAVEGRNTAAGDVVLLDVMGKVDDEPIALENKTVELSDGEAPASEPLPGLAAKLLDIAPDTEDLELEYELPAAGEGEAGQQAKLLVTIKDIKERVIPELDDDFAKDTGEAESLDELREVYRKKLVEQDEERAREEGKRLMLREIVKRNKVPVVPAMVDRYIDQRLRMQKAMMGMNPDEATDFDAMLKEQMREEAAETVTSGMMIEAIGKKEQVEISDEEVDKRLEELAQSRNQSLAKVKADFQKKGDLDALKRRMTEEKVLDLLVSKGNLILEDYREPEPEEGTENKDESAAEGEETAAPSEE